MIHTLGERCRELVVWQIPPGWIPFDFAIISERGPGYRKEKVAPILLRPWGVCEVWGCGPRLDTQIRCHQKLLSQHILWDTSSFSNIITPAERLITRLYSSSVNFHRNCALSMRQDENSFFARYIWPCLLQMGPSVYTGNKRGCSEGKRGQSLVHFVHLWLPENCHIQYQAWDSVQFGQQQIWTPIQTLAIAKPTAHFAHNRGWWWTAGKHWRKWNAPFFPVWRLEWARHPSCNPVYGASVLLDYLISPTTFSISLGINERVRGRVGDNTTRLWRMALFWYGKVNVTTCFSCWSSLKAPVVLSQLIPGTFRSINSTNLPWGC